MGVPGVVKRNSVAARAPPRTPSSLASVLWADPKVPGPPREAGDPAPSVVQATVTQSSGEALLGQDQPSLTLQFQTFHQTPFWLGLYASMPSTRSATASTPTLWKNGRP